MKIRCLIFISLFLVIHSFVFSQEYTIDKGASFISGMGSFMREGIDKPKGSNYYSVTTSFNHFVVKNLFIGGGFEFSGQFGGISVQNTLGVGPNIGYAFGNSNSIIFPYLDAGFHYIRKSYSKGEITLSGTDAFIGLGIIIPLKPHLGLVVEGDYNFYNLKSSDHSSSSNNVIAAGIGIVGILL